MRFNRIIPVAFSAAIFYRGDCLSDIPIRQLKAAEKDSSKITYIVRLFNCLYFLTRPLIPVGN